MSYSTGCHKCGGYPGAGGPRERAALYQCLNCGSFTCNQHLVGLVVRSCPACNGQKLKQVSTASRIARQSRQQSKLSNDNAGVGRSKSKNTKQQTGSNPSPADDRLGLTGAISAPQGKVDLKNYTAATINLQANKGFKNQRADVSEIMRHLTGDVEDRKHDKQGLAVLTEQQLEENKKHNVDIGDISLDDLDALDLDNITLVAVVDENGSAKADKQEEKAEKKTNAPLGFWAEPDPLKRKARIHADAQHDALFELDSPQFYSDVLKRIAATHKARETACHLVALRLDNQPEADISAHLSTFEEQVEPIFTSLQIRLLDGAPSIDMQTYRNLHEHHPSLSAVGPVYLTSAHDAKQDTMLKEAAALAVELKCPLYISIRGHAEINLPELLHDEIEQGLTGIMVSHYVDAMTLLMVQDHGWFMTIRPEHTYDENKDSVDFIRCLPFEKLLLSTGNEINAPQPHRGHFNGPTHLKNTFIFTQKLLDCKPEVLKKQAIAAWRYLFLGDPLPKDPSQ